MSDAIMTTLKVTSQLAEVLLLAAYTLPNLIAVIFNQFPGYI